MVEIHPFRALRPDPAFAAGVASVPYDVISNEEAAERIREDPRSFLRVSRADAELPGTPPHDDSVYLRARENLLAMVRDGVLRRDAEPSLYLYQVGDGEHRVTGLVCTIGVDDYLGGTIRSHELTRRDKEEDRTRHIAAVNAQTGLVFLFYRNDAGIGKGIDGLVPSGEEPGAGVRAANGSIHRVFRIGDPATIAEAALLVSPLSRLYIADGHHRAAAAKNVALRRRETGRGGGEADRFMAVLFPHDQVAIHGYSRLVTDLNGLNRETFLAHLARRFHVRRSAPGWKDEFRAPGGPPPGTRLFRMYLAGEWYEVSRPGEPPAAGVPLLDVQVLQDEVLGPLLGIRDPRDDPRLQFLGGSRPLSDLTERVDGGGFAVAFVLRPVRIDEVMAIADAGGIMPPKSTWFEPKLFSGLLVHPLD
ncbi:MAG TPA: DUF1015 family protein [Methanomicrobiales archaeon]|nr:DUF1015 family protein [Methanomicrobiales archaeon]